MTQTPPAPLMIIGANGRVGRLLRPAFHRMAVPVTWSQRRDDGPQGGLSWAPLDGPDPFVDWVRGQGIPAAVLVLAGTTPATGGDMAVNTAVAQASVAAARAGGVTRILLASSSAVYGTGRGLAWSEDDAVDPPTDYGRAKLAMERSCAGGDVCALRIGNVAGADALLTNPARPVVIDRFDDGRGPQRSYIGPQSLARVLWALATHPMTLPSVVNIGTPNAVDMAELAQAAGIPFVRRPAPSTAIARLTLDSRRLETLVGFTDTESAPGTLVAQWRACVTPKAQPAP